MSIHFMLQGKGGVGKTTISALFSQYLKDQGKNIYCIDTDSVNASFYDFKQLGVHRVELFKNNEVSMYDFDKIVELIAQNPNQDYILDNGASSFVPLSGYMLNNNIIDIFNSFGHEVLIHTIIAGGAAMDDTMTGLNSILEQFPDKVKVIVWLNEFLGNIEKDGKDFDGFGIYQNNTDRIHGIIQIRKQPDMFAEAIKTMLSNKLTFEEVKMSEQFDFMAKMRIDMFKKQIFEQMDAVFSSTHEEAA